MRGAVHAGTGSALPFRASVKLAVLDDVLGARVDSGADHDLRRLGRALEPSRGVDGITSEHAIARVRGTLDVDEHLARLDADPHRKRRLAFCGEPAVQLGQDRLHLERGADGTLCVVLVRPRDAEHCEDGVAHDLLQQPLVEEGGTALVAELRALGVPGAARRADQHGGTLRPGPDARRFPRGLPAPRRPGTLSPLRR